MALLRKYLLLYIQRHLEGENEHIWMKSKYKTPGTAELEQSERKVGIWKLQERRWGEVIKGLGEFSK